MTRSCDTCAHRRTLRFNEPCVSCAGTAAMPNYVAAGHPAPTASAAAPAARPVMAPMLRKQQAMILPTDSEERKGIPICTGVLDYFPLALAEVARVSKAGNDQHNPGQPLHWDRPKSTDHADCISRHLIDRFTRDSDGQRHAAKLAWRALAFLQDLLEEEQAK